MLKESIPYTYLLINKATKQVYYGCRYAKGCNPDDLWVTYFSSSKYVKELIQEHGIDSFEHKIRRTFSSAELARNWENRVLKRMKVINDNRFLNKTDNKSISPEDASKGQKGKTGSLSPSYGRKNKALSALNSSRIGEKNHMFGRRGELAPRFGITGEKHPMYGKHHTEEAKQKISSKKEMCCHCNKVFTIGNIRRWHNDNCKLKEN